MVVCLLLADPLGCRFRVILVFSRWLGASAFPLRWLGVLFALLSPLLAVPLLVTPPPTRSCKASFAFGCASGVGSALRTNRSTGGAVNIVHTCVWIYFFVLAWCFVSLVRLDCNVGSSALLLQPQTLCKSCFSTRFEWPRLYFRLVLDTTFLAWT